MMDRLQLIEEQNAQFTHVFRVLLVISEPPRKTARAEQQLPGGGIVAMRFLAREGVARNFLQYPFAHADAGDRKSAQVQVASQREKGDSSDAHHVGAVPPHAVSLHALACVPL